MRKPKRVEAWGVTADAYYPNAHLYRTKRLAMRDKFDTERLVHLVEEDRAAAAVVRAAVKWSRSHQFCPRPGNKACDVCLAVEKYLKAKGAK